MLLSLASKNAKFEAKFFFGAVKICAPDYSFTSYLMLLYSFEIYYIYGIGFILLFVRKAITNFYFMILALSISLWNDVILKNIIRQERPEGACSNSFGMPSGHSVSSLCFFTWFTLEILFGSRKNYSKKMKLFIISLIGILLLPVPYSRVYLGYHSKEQVIVGSITGIFYAICFFFLFQKFHKKIYMYFTKWFDIIDDYNPDATRKEVEQKDIENQSLLENDEIKNNDNDNDIDIDIENNPVNNNNNNNNKNKNNNQKNSDDEGETKIIYQVSTSSSETRPREKPKNEQNFDVFFTNSENESDFN
ncbi:hypothetical protein M0811_03717 [Anaeramoeba ignava]|uniref:Phosphatidic acid phosphatase type 2/haloperoxidase domain-containing protein n=1 Tax=Anaeramoeba ignava TaxID=1746090 RepID=A0A9Q0RHW7_ANAIG|nr:hypothetical protein M0811_03717 [Anaeramoeba ignava]